MSHSWYICNIRDRTCFDLSSNVMTDDFEDLCRTACLYNISFDEFMDMADSRMLNFDIDKIRQLYDYIQNTPPAYFEFVSHEDDLCERIFDITNDPRPIEQVGSLYTNSDKHTFNKPHSMKI
jgi:hypothetical protein